MSRPVSLLPARLAAASRATLLTCVMVVGLSGIGLVGPAPAASAASVAADQSPLDVTIDRLTPSAIPRKGAIRVSGTVTNEDDQTWTTVNIYAFISCSPAACTPMTTSAELAEAAKVDPEDPVGDRITAPGTYDSIPQLAPGQSARYSLKVPRSRLKVTEPGVYWFGVHALGQDAEGRDTVADGRARTFMPYVPSSRRGVDTALVVPVRHEVAHRADGRLANVAAWARTLSPGGPLDSLVTLGDAARSHPISWLVDPAVPDAVRQLVEGNPPRAPGATTGTAPGDGSSPSPGADPSASPGDTEESPALAAARDAGAEWLEHFREGLDGDQILALPYGDVDVASATQSDPTFYRLARRRAGTSLEPWGLPVTPAVSSPRGYLPPTAIRRTAPGTTLIVTDRMFGDRAPSVAHAGNHTLVVASSGAASGGPGPNDPQSPMSMRQRILSEAAVRLLTAGRKPLIVVLPQNWAPQHVGGFFRGLDQPWLHLTTVATATQRAGVHVSLDRVHYPEAQVALHLPAANFTAAQALMHAGQSLQALLAGDDDVAAAVQDEALTGASYETRTHPGLARDRAERSRGWIERQMRSVHIDAPRAVTLSSGSGRFAATITNDLDEPVTVRLEAVPERPLQVSVPRQTIDIGPDSRTTVLLNARFSGAGVRNVTLLLTDAEGVPIGSSDALPIRSNQVSNVIWLILGTGVALLFGAIGVRLWRRVRAAGQADAGADGTAGAG